MTAAADGGTGGPRVSIKKGWGALALSFVRLSVPCTDSLSSSFSLLNRASPCLRRSESVGHCFVSVSADFQLAPLFR